jgi:hypothetical protein
MDWVSEFLNAKVPMIVLLFAAVILEIRHHYYWKAIDALCAELNPSSRPSSDQVVGQRP